MGTICGRVPPRRRTRKLGPEYALVTEPVLCKRGIQASPVSMASPTVPEDELGDLLLLSDRELDEAAQSGHVIDDIVRVAIVRGRVAVVTLLGSGSEAFAWGTRKAEHRINPRLLSAVNEALDMAENDERVCAVVVTGEGRFFSNGMDLKWLDANPELADDVQASAERLLARILCFCLPTVAAINGHFCAAGGMLGLAFDYRLMNEDKGLFFVPAIDLGLVYSPGMTALMKAKTPVDMHNEMIVYSRRYRARELEELRVVKAALPSGQVLPRAASFALRLTEKNRFRGTKYRETMHAIKSNTYAEAKKALLDDRVHSMGFDKGDWDESGRAKL